MEDLNRYLKKYIPQLVDLRMVGRAAPRRAAPCRAAPRRLAAPCMLRHGAPRGGATGRRGGQRVSEKFHIEVSIEICHYRRHYKES